MELAQTAIQDMPSLTTNVSLATQSIPIVRLFLETVVLNVLEGISHRMENASKLTLSVRNPILQTGFVLTATMVTN